jgi:hypothetical protein
LTDVEKTADGDWLAPELTVTVREVLVLAPSSSRTVRLMVKVPAAA